MILNNKNGLQFFTFPKLNVFKNVRHGIFTRNNGFSIGDYHSLNVGLFVGDKRESVENNRQIIARGIDAQKLVFSNQVHKIDILIFKKSDNHRSLKADGIPSSKDAMITDIPGKTLAIQLADCQGILLVDPKNKVVANVHSGWRGSIKNILGACVTSMQSEFGCRPENIYAGISPSLGPCCAEFIHYQQEIPKKYWRYKNTVDYFDFWKISTHQLHEAGVIPENIEISNICTKCNSHLFFSFRQKNQTGRFVSVIGLK